MSRSFADSPPFRDAARTAVADSQLRANLSRATATIRERRDRVMDELPDLEELRVAAAGIKDDALARLPELLREVEERVSAAGGHVHFARDAGEANEIVSAIVRATGEDEVVKVKSMTTAETGLNDSLAADGITVSETDLAELIVQLGEDLPSHIVVPAIHRNRAEIRETFVREMGRHGLAAPDGLTDDPADLAAAARAHLRERFLRAKVAISGANFVVAESGSLVVVESEGNGRMCLTLADTLISLVGIDKVVPRFEDLEVFLQLLPRSATGERMNPYTSIWTGPVPGDGPSRFHLVLLDNGRSRALADRVGRQALRCIRCAACLNVCPVYERVGGHAYGSVYPGPIGAVLTPQLDHVATDPVAASLPYASTLCGACFAACPVRIDIPRLLVHLRAEVVDAKRAAGPTAESAAMAVASYVLEDAGRLGRAERLAARVSRLLYRHERVRRLPGALAGWTDTRDAPLPAATSFRDWWPAERTDEPGDQGPGAPSAQDGGSARRALVRALLPRFPWSNSSSQAATRLGASSTTDGPATDARAAVLSAVERAIDESGGTDLPPRLSPPGERGQHRIEVPRGYRRAGTVSLDDPLRLLVSRLEDYRACVAVVGAADLPGAVADALAATGTRSVVAPLDVPEAWLSGLHGRSVTCVRDDGRDGGLSAADLDGIDASVTGCAVAIAETGTLVLDGGATQGRRIVSLVPDHLLVVVHARQIVASVPDAVASVAPTAPQTWISGPSATSDIELSRVEGVHGPRHLSVLLVDDTSS